MQTHAWSKFSSGIIVIELNGVTVPTLHHDMSAYLHSLEYFLESLSGFCVHRLRFGDSTLFGNIARIASSYVSTDDRTSDRGVPHVLSTLQNIAQVYQEKGEMDNALPEEGIGVLL